MGNQLWLVKSKSMLFERILCARIHLKQSCMFGCQVSPVLVREELFTSVVNLRLERTVSYFQTIGVTYEVSCLLLCFSVGIKHLKGNWRNITDHVSWYEMKNVQAAVFHSVSGHFCEKSTFKKTWPWVLLFWAQWSVSVVSWTRFLFNIGKEQTYMAVPWGSQIQSLSLIHISEPTRPP